MRYQYNNSNCFNPIDCISYYTATSNDMKLVQWLLMDELLHFIQQEGDWAGHSSMPVYQSPYWRIMVHCSAVLICPWRANTTGKLANCKVTVIDKLKKHNLDQLPNHKNIQKAADSVAVSSHDDFSWMGEKGHPACKNTTPPVAKAYLRELLWVYTGVIGGFNVPLDTLWKTILWVIWPNQQCHSTERQRIVNHVKGQSHQAQLTKK